MILDIIVCLAALSFLLILWADAWSNQYLTSEGAAEATYLDTLTMRLFQNNITFSTSTVIGGLTESTFSGYAAVAISGASAGAISGNAIPITYAGATFTRSTTGATQTAYGYYLTDGGGNLVGGGTFPGPGPYVFVNAGDTLTVPLTDTITRV